MEFWVLWFIGIVVAIVVRIIINLITSNDNCSNEYYIEAKSIPIQIMIYVFVIGCIILVGGIANAQWLGNFGTYAGEGPVLLVSLLLYIIIEFVIAVLSYVLVWILLDLDHFGSRISQLCFLIIFVISIIGWTIPISNYNRNIETITETEIISVQERNLLFFDNVPVQNISDNVSGSSILETVGISGNVFASDKLSYWYIDENEEGKYDSVNAKNSRVVFISNEEKPNLKIIVYCDYTKTINHNNGGEEIKKYKEWEEYIFYLPESILQYSFS